MLAATVTSSARRVKTKGKTSPSWKVLINAVQAHSTLTCAGLALAQISSARYALAKKSVSTRVRGKLETITHIGTSTKMKAELMRRNTDAPGAGKNVLASHHLKGRMLLTRHSGSLCGYDIPRREYKDEDVDIREECFKHISLER